MNRRAMIHTSRTDRSQRAVSLALLTLVITTVTLATSGCKPDAATTQADASASQSGAPLAGSAIGGPFTLVDKTGGTVRWSDFAGKYRVVYFGYTFCPDACPTDVNTLMQGFARFTAAHPVQAARTQPMFISIDPARDTPKIVGEFASAFSPRLLGLTGSESQVAQAVQSFRVYRSKGAVTPGGYLMDHSRISYLMGPNGGPLSMLPTDQGADAVAAELARWVK